MKSYEIVQTTSGESLGIYEGETPMGAIAAMLADAGAAGAEPDPGLRAVEVGETTTERALARAGVARDAE